MLSGEAVLAQIEKLDVHPNADRLMVATVLGEHVIVGLDAKVGDRVVYFSCDLQLSEEFCEKNDLVARFDENNKRLNNGHFDKNRRVRAQAFRGVKSNGFVVPLSYFDYTDSATFLQVANLGYSFAVFNGHEICQKYETQSTKNKKAQNNSSQIKKQRCPLFYQHFDTEHLRYHWKDTVYSGSKIILTEKIHSTSGRFGLLPDTQPYKFKLLNWLHNKIGKIKYQYFIGSRRVIIGTKDMSFRAKGFYDDETFRFKSVEKISLVPGEVLYYELAAINANGQALMPSVPKEKMPKNLKEKYFSPMVFSYGLKNNERKIWVYRITRLVNGIPQDLCWNDLVKRCKELNIDTVPFIDEINVPYETTLENFLSQEKVENLSVGSSILDGSHIREGVAVRIESPDEVKIFKYKSYDFYICEGIMKDKDYVDIEEAS